MPTPSRYIYDSTERTLPYERAHLCHVYIHDGVDAHRCLHLTAILKFPRFQLIRRKRKANVFLVKIGQALDSRQRLIASNPQNDKCKSNEKNRFFQTFMG